MVRASVSLGHSTYIYVHPAAPQTRPLNLDLRREFRSVGVRIIEVCIYLFLSYAIGAQRLDAFMCVLAPFLVLAFFNQEVRACRFDAHPMINKGYIFLQLYLRLLLHMSRISSPAKHWSCCGNEIGRARGAWEACGSTEAGGHSHLRSCVPSGTRPAEDHRRLCCSRQHQGKLSLAGLGNRPFNLFFPLWQRGSFLSSFRESNPSGSGVR